MANRFWVGGTGNWDQSSTANWSATDGGASGASVPVAGDDVFINANSGSGTITITASAPCRSLQTAASSIATLVHNASVTLTIGDGTAGASNIALDLSGLTTYTLGSGSTSAITFASTSTTQQTITTNGKVGGNITFDGAGGSWILSDNFSSGTAGNWVLTRGSLDTNGKTVTCRTFSSDNSNTRSLTLGASAINTTVNGTNWWGFATVTGLTFNAGTSTLTCSNMDNTSFQGGGLTYNNVTHSNGRAGIFGANTFANLTVTGNAASARCALEANQTVTGTFTATGSNAGSGRMHIAGASGNSGLQFGAPQRTITAAAVALTNVDFSDILGAGAATWSGTSIGDIGGNTNITFDTPVTRYWVATSGGSYSATSSWSTSSGGASGATVPLPHDDVYFDANSITSSGRTITVDVRSLGKNVDFSAVLNNPTIGIGVANATYLITGSWTLKSGMTINSGSITWALVGRGTHTFTSGGITFSNELLVENGTGTYTFQDAFTSTGRLQFVSGTLNTNDVSITVTEFLSTRNVARTLNLGNSTISCTTTSNVWRIQNDTPMVLNAGTSTIAITNTSSSSKTLVFGTGKTHYNVTITGGGSGAVLFTSSTTMNDLTVGAPKTLTISASQTITVNGTPTMTGTAVDGIVLNSSSGTNHTITSPAGKIFRGDYLTISDSNATGGLWYAGRNSTDNGGGNTGWFFMDRQTPGSNLQMMGMG